MADRLTQRVDRELKQPHQHALKRAVYSLHAGVRVVGRGRLDLLDLPHRNHALSVETYELGAHCEAHAARLVDELLLQTHQFRVEAQISRNRAIAHLLLNFGMVHEKVEVALDLYFKQCSILVNCRDPAVMGATLSNLGKNSLTGGEVYDIDRVKDMLSI